MFDWFFAWIGSIFAHVVDWVVSLFPDWIGDGFASINDFAGPLAKYGFWLLGLDVVIPTILGAYVVRFLIRRIPFIG